MSEISWTAWVCACSYINGRANRFCWKCKEPFNETTSQKGNTIGPRFRLLGYDRDFKPLPK